VRSIRAVLLAALALAPAAALALLPEDGQPTLSPYFHVPQADGGEPLPLEETRAEVTVAGPIARVTVHQTFRNRGSRPIEAVYVFPASTRAAVHALAMRIGERTIEARIDRRDRARAGYEAARDGGRRAALLEQQRPNVFTMNVANVLPGERIEVALEYSELLVPEDGTYELVYPAVVGPRYGGGADPAEDRWIASPYLRAGEREPWRFSFAARVESALPLRDLSSPSHAVDVRFPSPTSAEVSLRDSGGGTRDVVLRWRLAGDAIQAGALLFPEGDGGWFAVAVEPPARAPAGRAALAREYVFLVDVSGSMHGFPLDTAKALLRDLLGRLDPRDRLNVVLFAGASQVLAPAGSLPATPENVARAIALLDAQRGGGGTELMAGLRTAYGVPRAPGELARSIVVVTDGYVGVEAQAFRFVRERLREASLFSFGIGSSVNRHLVEGLARAGEGEPFVVLSADRARAAAERFRAYVERPVLTGIDVRFEGLDVEEVLPARAPTLFARRPVVVVGRYRGAPRGRAVVEGVAGDGPWRAEVDLARAAASAAHAPLRVLWARARVAALEDDRALAPAKELDDAIAELGLAHRLLTRLTSFVAIDSEVVSRGGRPEEVRQPLPLPDGVSDLAVAQAQKLSAHAQPLPFAPSGADRSAAESSAPRDALGDRAGREPAAAPAPSVKPSVKVEAAPGVDAAALARALEARLRAAGIAPARCRVRVVLDAEGRVTRVEVLDPTTEERRRIVRALSGAATGVRSPAGTTAVVQVGP
jgi:Ca-activated chloride channel family protein